MFGNPRSDKYIIYTYMDGLFKQLPTSAMVNNCVPATRSWSSVWAQRQEPKQLNYKDIENSCNGNVFYFGYGSYVASVCLDTFEIVHASPKAA